MMSASARPQAAFEACIGPARGSARYGLVWIMYADSVLDENELRMRTASTIPYIIRTSSSIIQHRYPMWFTALA